MHLLISENFPPKIGGSGRWFWEIYTRLQHDKYIVAAGTDPLASAFDASHSLRSERWPLTMESWGITSFPSLRTYINLFLLLRSTVKYNNVVAVHCGRGLPEGLLGFLAWNWFGIPYLCYVHGEELPTYHSSREYKFLSQLVYANAHCIIVNSYNTQQSFVSHTGVSNSVRVMHPGVDTTYFNPKEKDNQVLLKLGWGGRAVVLTVGRLQKRKGHDHVILAVKQVRNHIPNILYVIAGDGEERIHLENLVASEGLQGHVKFLGKVDDATMLDCYQQCDLFILANREVNGDFEGFGMVLVEAQACGKPVIAGKSGGTSETMIPGETGLLVDTEDPSVIADAILLLLGNNNKLEYMGKCAEEWVRGNFDWRILTTQAEEIFSELLEIGDSV